MLQFRNNLIHGLSLSTILTRPVQKEKKAFICDKEPAHVEYVTQLLEVCIIGFWTKLVHLCLVLID